METIYVIMQKHESHKKWRIFNNVESPVKSKEKAIELCNRFNERSLYGWKYAYSEYKKGGKVVEVKV